MITQRFRPLAWVAGVGIAATALYTVSLQVANERARLQGLEDKIAATKSDIRQLQTELGTRGSLRQLERWNGEVLSLVAPGATQFLADETALTKVDGAIVIPGKYVPAPVMVAAASGDPAGQPNADVSADEASQTATQASSLSSSQSSSLSPTKAQRVAVLEDTLTGKTDTKNMRRSAAVKLAPEKAAAKP